MRCLSLSEGEMSVLHKKMVERVVLPRADVEF